MYCFRHLSMIGSSAMSAVRLCCSKTEKKNKYVDFSRVISPISSIIQINFCVIICADLVN